MGRGALTFKGDSNEKAKKKHQKSKHKTAETTGATTNSAASSTIPLVTSVAAATAVSTPADPSPTESKAPPPPKVENGTGMVTVSGTVVTGHATKFTSQVRVGDAMIVDDEMRVISMVLSDMSCNLSSTLASSIMTPTSFQFIRKPSSKKPPSSQEQSNQGAIEIDNDIYHNRSNPKNELVYRESTSHGSYRIRHETVAPDTSRTRLLEMRAKKKRDKYC